MPKLQARVLLCLSPGEHIQKAVVMCAGVAQTFDWVQNTLIHQRLELRVPLGIKAI